MSEFRKFIEDYTYVSDEDWTIINSKFIKKELPKKFTLLKQGEVCNKIYFLESGLIRYFILKNSIEF